MAADHSVKFTFRKLIVHAYTLPEITLYEPRIGVKRTRNPPFLIFFISEVFLVHLAG